ncbi:MAG: CoA-binding protein [Pseudonocardiales bacterium]|nr:CoA-binding protein [Pseudonocardiales bacterium]
MRSARIAAVARMLDPASLAIVGASDKRANLRTLVELNERSGVTVHLVNPRRSQVLDRPAIPDLEALSQTLGEPVDTVLCLLDAAATPDIVESAAHLGVGGVVLTAAGFAEAGPAGATRQARIAAVAREHNLAVCGPNGNGFLNPSAGKSLFLGPVDQVRRGGLALISHSGGMLTSALTAGAERMLGFSHLISAGNEAVTDLVDYVDVLLDDDQVHAIAMIVEQVRRPAAFLEAAYRARALGKPLLALKLGRSAIGQRMGASHTGALMGNARDYNAAFAQTGVLVTRDLDDLFDQCQLFANLAPERWRTSRRVAVLTASGGDAALVSDAFETLDIPLPVDDEVAAWTRERVPTNALGNPFDITGLLYTAEEFGPVLDRYLASECYDTVLVVGKFGPTQEQFAAPLSTPLLATAPRTTKRLIACTGPAYALGPWTETLIDAGVGVASGIGPVARSLHAMNAHLAVRDRAAPPPVVAVPAPAETEVAADGEHQLLRFSAAARLAESFGIPMAPFVELDPTRQDIAGAVESLPPAASYVIKVANSLHRTEIGAVLRSVGRPDVLAAVKHLSDLATSRGGSPEVVVQPELAARGEVLLGSTTDSPFGPVVLFGLGGIFVEVLADVTARLAPFTAPDALDMIDALRARPVLAGLRGAPPWNVVALADILVGFSRLAAATAGWLAAIDINPLLVTETGYAAVDIGCVVRSRTQRADDVREE